MRIRIRSPGTSFYTHVRYNIRDSFAALCFVLFDVRLNYYLIFKDSRPLAVSPPPQYEKCFIQRYLGGESRPPQPDIHFAKTGHRLVHCPKFFLLFTVPGTGGTLESDTIKPSSL
jgi:hypothetical protein